MNALTRIAATTLALVMLTGSSCGGGGGGGGSAVEVPFTSFAAIGSNQTVVMDGTAVTASGNQSLQPSGFILNSANLNPVGSGTVRLTYDGSRALKAISISTPQSSAFFDRDAAGHSLDCSGVTCIGGNPTSFGIAIDAFAAGWNYQTFGVWASDTSPSTWSGGAISVGAPTPGSAVPVSTSATFSGVATGFYANSSGTPFFTAASMTANVDFGLRTIGFSTSNTETVDLNTAARLPNTGLNLSGTFSYASGANSFSGSLNAANGLLSGQGSGRFYGPAAEEIGGVYSLQGSGGTMFGGFGGKR